MTRILRIGAVTDRTGLSRPTIYRRMGEETFPQQIQLGPNSVGWDEAEIEEWLANRPTGPLPEPKAGDVRRRRQEGDVRRRRLETAHAT